MVDALVQTGNIRRARDIAQEYVRKYPESAGDWLTWGIALVADGRLDDARAAFEKAEELDPLESLAKVGRRNVALIQGRWADAEAVADQLRRSANPFDQFRGYSSAVTVLLARGRGRDALTTLERATHVSPLAQFQIGLTRMRQALVLLKMKQPAPAMARAQLAVTAASGNIVQYEALQVLAVSQAASGRAPAAEKTLALLESRAKAIPADLQMRRLHWARGDIALMAGDTSRAVSELTEALRTLPVRGPVLFPTPPHGDLWLSAALAFIKAGRDADAAALLQRLQGGYERAFAMDAYARSFFLLGQIYDRQGSRDKAREQYARFVDLWGDGDLERGWVADAQKRLAEK